MEQTKAPFNWFRFLSRYGVMLLALIVAINQLRLRDEGISSWKGGGFGMYADFHPVYTKVFVKSNAPSPQPSGYQYPTDKAIKLSADSRLFPSQKRLESLKQEYVNFTGISELEVQVWKPAFNASTGVFGLYLERKH